MSVAETIAFNPRTQPDGSTALTGIAIQEQALCLSVGLMNGAPSFVRVAINTAGVMPRWSMNKIGASSTDAKYFIGTEDGQYWWNVPSSTPYPNNVSLIADKRRATSFIIKFSPDYRIEAPYGPGGYMAPMGGGNAFYFATGTPQSSLVYFPM
jgi:hypothetical protein